MDNLNVSKQIQIQLFDDPQRAPKSQTKCCSPSQSVSLVEVGRQLQGITQVAVETGVYSSSPSVSAPSGCSSSAQLQNLDLLATVACDEVRDSTLRHRAVPSFVSFVKKRRTPRSFLGINGSRFANGGCSRRLPATAKRQRITNLHFWSPPPWLDMSEQLKSNCDFVSPPENLILSDSEKKVILKFGSQQSAGKKTCQRPDSSHKLIKGERLQSAIPRLRDGRPPGKDTRVQRFSKRILKFVSKGSIAEKFIRGALGNNPDTSKALRLLLRQQKLERLGDGGRGTPFLYVATPAGLRELEESAMDNKARAATDSQSVVLNEFGHS